MFEKVNPSHPDKIADRIAGAIVDLAYTLEENPKIAVEVLIGHGSCHVIIESSVDIQLHDIKKIVKRISGVTNTLTIRVKQDEYLANNQLGEVKCGDNGIFKGTTTSKYEKLLTNIAGDIYNRYPYDGKYILRTHNNGAAFETIICQSHLPKNNEIEIINLLQNDHRIGFNIINPLGEWTGGIDVDSGATNRKLGSDMGEAVTGGGLHGKDLSKADVSINIFTYLLMNYHNLPITLNDQFKKIHNHFTNLIFNKGEIQVSCAIGDTEINFEGYKVPYKIIVETAREYIKLIGGFEKFAEWGLLRPNQLYIQK